MLISFRTALALSFSVAFLVAIAPTLAQKKPSPGIADREHERRSLAVNLVRAVNTAEANYKSKEGAYVSWNTLFGNGDFSENGTKWASESVPTVAHAMYGPGPEIVPGWKLRLHLSKDGNAYDLLLEDVTDPKCSFAIISDERGLIREGKAIDCSS